MKKLNKEPRCPVNSTGHEWTKKFSGGCTDNPGIWSDSNGGLYIVELCRYCGARREEHRPNSPQESRTVEFGQPDINFLFRNLHRMRGTWTASEIRGLRRWVFFLAGPGEIENHAKYRPLLALAKAED
jgi:hypothetical protein